MKLPVLALVLLLPACAQLKTRYAGEETLSCGKPLNAADYCANFDATSELKSDPEAVRGKARCVDFYREALRSTSLLCSYFEELDSNAQWGEGEDSATVSAKGKRIHRKYAALAKERSRTLEHSYGVAGGKGAVGAMDELTFEGRTELEGELDCTETASPRAGGLALIGLAAQSRRDQKQTYDRLQSALKILADVTSLAPPRPYQAILTAMGLGTGDQTYSHAIDRIISTRLDEPTMLALGKSELPENPRVEQYYAEAVTRLSEPPGTGEKAAASGRSLASVHCPR